MLNDKQNKIDKKYIFLFIAVIILLTTFLIIASPEIVKIIVNNATAFVKTEVEIPVSLENDETIYGIQFIVYYDPSGLEFISVTPTSRFSDAALEANEVEGKIKIAGVTEKGISPGKESILNLIFYAKNKGLYDLKPEEILIADIDTQLFSTESVTGILTVKES